MRWDTFAPDLKNLIYINGKELKTWNAFLEAGSYAEFLAPGPMKEYIENDFRSQHGRQVIVSTPRVDARDFSIQIVLNGSSPAELLTNYNSLLAEFEQGAVDIQVPDLGYTYHCIYKQASKLRNYNLLTLTMSVMLNEPNPKNRTLIHGN